MWSSEPFSRPASPSPSLAQLYELTSDTPSNEDINQLDNSIAVHNPSDSSHQFAHVDQPLTHPSDNALSLLEPHVNNVAEHKHHGDKEGHGRLSYHYTDFYDADDELPEEYDEGESSDIYFEEPGSPFSLLPDVRSYIMGEVSSPLLAGDIPTLGDSILSGGSWTTSRNIHHGLSTQTTSASNPPADFTSSHSQPIPPPPSPFSSSPPPTAPSTPVLSPPLTPSPTPAPIDASTLRAWFDIPTPPTSPPLSPLSPSFFFPPSTNLTTTWYHNDPTTTYQSDFTYYSDSAYDEASSSSSSDGEGGGRWQGLHGWDTFEAVEMALAVVLVEQELEGLGEGVWRGLMGVDTEGEGEGEESDGGSDGGSEGGGDSEGGGESDGSE
ncbi:hypothetical protein B0I37DRAFT_448523 [Chaetomium sp. MPI-CAGE-AT-0009]|nr:hypothetical protein B0I37DRAFT_448523 [Chaetomium sp. MPI-CAGE-AT-0009]